MKSSISTDCPFCHSVNTSSHWKGERLACQECNREIGTIPDNWTLSMGCPICSSRHLYRRKDFNQLFGLLIVVAGAVIAVMISYWVLLVLVLLDLALYRRIADMAICYRCQTEIRGCEGINHLSVFTHHTAEIYEYGSDENETGIASGRGRK